MADQRIQYTEEMVGNGHPTKSDTLNRLSLIEHNTDGTHKSGIALGTPASGNLSNCTGYPSASTTVTGVSELATTDETITGTDTARTTTPAGVAGAMANERIKETQNNVEVVSYDSGYYPSQHVYIPKFTYAEEVSGVNFGGFAVDKYICSQPNARPDQGSPDVAHSGAAGAVPAISRPGVPVWDYITLPQAMIASANKGKGWHLMTAFEWASLAFLSKKLGTQPHGGNANVNPPADSVYTTETALLDAHHNGETGSYYRALPGTGPNTWAHNHLASGVFDLQGLVWEWNMGLFMQTDGHVDVLGSLDVSYGKSPFGRGTISGSGGASPTLTLDGSGVNWLKSWTADEFNGMQVYIAEAASGAGAFYTITDTTATTLILTNGDAPGNGTATFVIVKHISTDVTSGMTTGQNILTLRNSDADLKPFALPATADATGAAAYGNDIYYFDKSAVRAVFRGGAFHGGADAGVFSLYLSSAPSESDSTVGFRACKAI
jgi:hypothetical protein